MELIRDFGRIANGDAGIAGGKGVVNIKGTAFFKKKTTPPRSDRVIRVLRHWVLMPASSGFKNIS